MTTSNNTTPKPPRIAVFIDAANLWGVRKIIGKKLKLDSFGPFFAHKFHGSIFQIFYYTAYPNEGTRPKEYIEKLHKFFTYLKKGLKFSVVKKPLKTIFLRTAEGDLIYDQTTGKAQSIEKGNFDVELAIDALKFSPNYDVAIFVTGDSDFLPLISYLRNLKDKKTVYVFSTKGCISNELKTGADGYFDIKDFPTIHGPALSKKTLLDI